MSPDSKSKSGAPAGVMIWRRAQRSGTARRAFRLCCKIRENEMRFAIAAAALFAATTTACISGCGGGDRSNGADTLAVDRADTSMAVDSVLVPLPAADPDERPSEETPSERAPSQRAPVEEVDALSGRYRLVSVQGESLPATIGMGPECELLLGEGELRIVESRRFTIQTKTWENCNGERGNELTHEAEGRMSLAGDRIRFEATYDAMFGSASGSVQDGEIHIDTFSTEGGEQEVEWTFRR